MTAEKDVQSVVEKLRSRAALPSPGVLSRSRQRVLEWFEQQAPLIQWSVMKTPLGALYAAVSPEGLCAVNFGVKEEEFLRHLDPRARLRRNPRGLAEVVEQLRAYFAGDRFSFELPVDLSALTAFQRRVLEVTRRITPGEVWTYHQVAEELGRPNSSRPVGQALARNPIPIVIPCHRVVASDGSLQGYSGGSGITAKRWLLDWEGARLPERKSR